MRLRRAPGVVVSLALSACSPFGSDEPATTDGGTNAEAAVGADAGPPAESCKALLAREPSRKGERGFYDIAPMGSKLPTPIHVYCDLALDGGGWTLVGRSSVTGVPQPFGWKSAAGDVTDLNQPYSLDAASANIVFTELLVGVRDPKSFDVTVRAYRMAVAPGFITAHRSDSVSTGMAVTVLGDCTPPNGGPEMLRFVGYTSLTDDFFLRDVAGDGEHRGLVVDKLDLTYANCDRGGSLDGHQGMLLVR